MKLLQPRFPHRVGGRAIPFLRVVKKNGQGQVVRVISSYNKEIEVVAICAVETIIPDASYSFTTAPGYVGHKELIQLLYEKGIHGSYAEWLRAIKAGDHQRAEEKEGQSVIRFECDLINEEEAAAWKIKSKKEPDAPSEVPIDVRERIKRIKEKYQVQG